MTWVMPGEILGGYFTFVFIQKNGRVREERNLPPIEEHFTQGDLERGGNGVARGSTTDPQK